MARIRCPKCGKGEILVEYDNHSYSYQEPQLLMEKNGVCSVVGIPETDRSIEDVPDRAIHPILNRYVCPRCGERYQEWEMYELLVPFPHSVR